MRSNFGGGSQFRRIHSSIRSCILQFFSNSAENPIKVFQHILVPESDYPEPPSPQIIIPLSIVCLLLFGVLSTVKFNNQISRQADKIHDIARHRMLPAKFLLQELSISQMTPQEAFDNGLLTTQPPCAFPHRFALKFGCAHAACLFWVTELALVRINEGMFGMRHAVRGMRELLTLFPHRKNFRCARFFRLPQRGSKSAVASDVRILPPFGGLVQHLRRR